MSVLETLLLGLAKFAAIVFGFVMLVATVLTLLERKQSALVQNRVGPNRAFLFGKKFPLSAFLGQIIADAVKVFVKEDFEPTRANKWIHRVAPLLPFVAAMMVWMVIPFGPGAPPGVKGQHPFEIAHLDVGILWVLAVSSLSVYGATMGAWASNSAFSLLGGLRTAAQMISYEVTIGLNLVGIFMIFGSLQLNDIIWGQGELIGGWLPKWGIVVQPLGFVLFMVAAVAEIKRAPFDLPEDESVLVAGFFTEYSSMRFAMFSLGEFIGIVVMGALATCLFLGGWQIPWVSTPLLADGTVAYGWFTVLQIVVFLVKTLFMVFLLQQIRWTFPRLRYDQLMKLGWVYMLPLSLANLVITAVIMYALK
ncbi:MAG: complex I subunit 1 family protein [Myxococcota bacterium]